MMGLLNFFGILLITGVLYSCSSIEYESPRYVQLAHKITNKTAKTLEKEKGVILVGRGGQMMNDIQMMAMSFDLYHEMSLEEARELIIFSVEKYLQDINENKEIKPFLHDDPFTAKNVEIRIWIWNSNKSTLSSKGICYLSVLKGKVSYYSNESDPDTPMHRETYDEAIDIVNSQNIMDSKAL